MEGSERGIVLNTGTRYLVYLFSRRNFSQSKYATRIYVITHSRWNVGWKEEGKGDGEREICYCSGRMANVCKASEEWSTRIETLVYSDYFDEKHSWKRTVCLQRSKEIILKLGSTDEPLMQRTSSVISIDTVLLFPVDKVGIILYNSFHLHFIKATLFHWFNAVLCNLCIYRFRSWFWVWLVCKTSEAWIYFRGSEQPESWRLRHEGTKSDMKLLWW